MSHHQTLSSSIPARVGVQRKRGGGAKLSRKTNIANSNSIEGSSRLMRTPYAVEMIKATCKSALYVGMEGLQLQQYKLVLLASLSRAGGGGGTESGEGSAMRDRTPAPPNSLPPLQSGERVEKRKGRRERGETKERGRENKREPAQTNVHVKKKKKRGEEEEEEDTHAGHCAWGGWSGWSEVALSVLSFAYPPGFLHFDRRAAGAAFHRALSCLRSQCFLLFIV